MTPEERFLAKIEEVDGHWIWIGAASGGRYGSFRDEAGRTVKAHRWSYEHWIGPIPEGFDVDHVCRVILCVRPHGDHLEAVTHAENVKRGNRNGNQLKTHCPEGHPYDEANTYHGRQSRGCRTCRAISQRRYRDRARDHGHHATTSVASPSMTRRQPVLSQ